MAKVSRLWDYLNSITQTKDLTVLQDEAFEKDYQPFIINKMLAQHKDCVLSAEQMNERPEMSKQLQFLYLFYAIRPRFRRSEKSIKHKKSDVVESLAEYYGCSARHARGLVSLHTDEQLAVVRQRIDKGGTGRKS